MLERYARPEMQELWGREETKLEYWLKVELAFLEARAEAGDISREAFAAIRDNAKINVARMKEIEGEVGHDMIAFVKMIQESLVAAGVGDHKERFHELLTSYNTEDPAMILLLRVATEQILLQLGRLRAALRTRAREHKYTYMIMRTHGQFAEPSTFGALCLVFEDAILRSMRRIESVYHEDLIHANISGAVGSYGEIDPNLEQHTATLLGLVPALAETQILQRDRHAAFLSEIAIAGASIAQMARTFWEMCRSEVGELQEPRSARQRGSSAMAHKKNPIGIELLMGMAAMENIDTPEGRDISQSNVERHIFPDATSQLHYMAFRATSIVEKLVVFPERMKENLEVGTYGTWAGQPLRTALMRAGVDYDNAYKYVQDASFAAVEYKQPLREIVSTCYLPYRNQNAADILGERLDDCFDYKQYIGRGIDHIFKVNGLA
jgi:adenylosuccinate lyase